MPRLTSLVLEKLYSLIGFKPVRYRVYSVLYSSGILEVVNRWFNDNCTDLDLREFVLNSKAVSKSQLQQDLLVAYLTEVKNLRFCNQKSESQRFFVEFGAADGITLSNTFLLEKQYGWDGILCEPAQVWREDLLRNRKCHIDFRIVYPATNRTLIFSETVQPEFSFVND